MNLGIGTLVGWKIDPDNLQDRKSSEVKSYKMSPEELEKYKNVVPGEKVSSEFRINVEQLRENRQKIKEAKEELKMDKEKIKVGDWVDVEPGHPGYDIKWEVKSIEPRMGEDVCELLSFSGSQIIAPLKNLRLAKAETRLEYTEVKDSGERRLFDTGAVRDIQKGKGRFDLLPPKAVKRLAKHFENGAVKYGDRNWEKGINISCYMDSALRHIFAYLDGNNDEDHLAAATWNCMCAIQTEIEKPELQNIPKRGEV